MSREVVHKYPEYVDTDNITIEVCGRFRYLLCVPYLNTNNNKSVLVIMKNPSKADNTLSDHTINNVLKFCHNRYGKVYIMNLFPYYSTNPSGVKEFINSVNFEKVMKKNNKFLNFLLGDVDDLIIAWGGNSIGNKHEYDKAIQSVLNDVKRLSKKAYAVRLKSTTINRKYPWHAQVWAVNHDLELYEWNIK